MAAETLRRFPSARLSNEDYPKKEEARSFERAFENLVRWLCLFSNRLLAAAEDQQAREAEASESERGRFRHTNDLESRH